MKTFFRFLALLLGLASQTLLLAQADNIDCYDLSLYLIPSEEIITNPSRTDGFGAQFQTIIYAVIYAELNNKKFVYTPFKKMAHNYEKDTDYINKKEKLINFIDNYEINEDSKIQKKHNQFFFIRFFEKNLSECANSQTLKEIKNIFRINKDKKNYFCDGNLHVAIHIRRPNSHDFPFVRGDTPDSRYIDIIKSLRKKYRDRNPLFHIYSQGDIETFRDIYNSKDIILHIDDSVEDTFTSLVLADVLVTCPSSLSYTAGILSEGTVYYIPFWHPPLPDWIPI